MIKCVVFDMAGTTVVDGGGNVKRFLDLAITEATQDSFAREIAELMGSDKRSTISAVLQSRVDKAYDYFVSWMCAFYKENAKAYENTRGVFRGLRSRGIKVVLNTGFPRQIADVIIEKLDWKDEIDFSICSDEVARGRPAPDMLHAIAAKLRIPIREMMKVGDTVVDIQEGRSAPCKIVVGTSYGSAGREKLSKHNPDVIIDDISEILGLV